MEQTVYSVLVTIFWLYNLHNSKEALDAKSSVYIKDEAERHLLKFQDMLTETVNHKQTTFTMVTLIEEVINDISIKHIRLQFDENTWASNTIEALTYLFNDPEFLGHWDNRSSNKINCPADLRSRVERLVECQRKKRKIFQILIELIGVLRDAKPGRMSQAFYYFMGVPAPYTHSELKIRKEELINQFKYQDSEAKRIFRSLAHYINPYVGVVVHYVHMASFGSLWGLERILFGPNEDEMVKLRQWRAGLSNRKVKKFERAIRKGLRFRGFLLFSNSPEKADFNYIKEQPLPVLGNYFKPSIAIEDKMRKLLEATPEQLEEIKFRLSSFYACIYKYWVKKHKSFEESLQEGSPTGDTPIPFKTPKQIVSESVCSWLTKQSTRSFEDIVQSVDWNAVKESMRNAPQQEEEWDALKTLIPNVSMTILSVDQIDFLVESLKDFVKKIDEDELAAPEEIYDELIRIFRGVTS